MPGTVRQILDRGRRQTAAQEERLDLAVLQRARRLGGAEPLPRDVTVGIESGSRSTRMAITSVPLPGEPVETVLPRRSPTDATPLEAVVTMCV